MEWFMCLHCRVCRAPTTYTVHLQNAMSIASSYLAIRLFLLPIQKTTILNGLSDRLCWHWLPPILGVPKAPQDERHVCDQSHQKDQPLCVKWPFATILSTCVLRIVAKGQWTKVKNKGSATKVRNSKDDTLSSSQTGMKHTQKGVWLRV